MSKIIESKVVIKFKTDSGYSSEETIGPRPDDQCLRSGLHALVSVLLTAGQEDLVRRTVDEAIEAHALAEQNDEQGEQRG